MIPPRSAAATHRDHTARTTDTHRNPHPTNGQTHGARGRTGAREVIAGVRTRGLRDDVALEDLHDGLVDVDDLEENNDVQDVTGDVTGTELADRTSGRRRRWLGWTGRAHRGVVGPPAVGGVRWTTGSAHASRGLRIAMAVALCCGPVTLLANLATGPSTVQPAAATATPTTPPGELDAVGEWAQSFVVAWLSTPAGNEKSLSYYLDDTSTLTLAQTPATVANPAVADIEPEATATTAGKSTASTASAAPSAQATASATATSGAGTAPADSGSTPTATPSSTDATRIWEVTIGIDVQEPSAQGNVVVRRYFAVPVSYTPVRGQQPAALRSLGQPGAVNAPAAGQAPELAYNDAISATGAVGSSVQAFLSAYLTDQGDVSRLLSPQAVDITAVRPAAYTAVQLRSLKITSRDLDTATPDDGERADVLATAIVTGLDGQTRSAQFSLSLTARAGRWEISQIQSTPLRDTDSSADNTDPEAAASMSNATSGLGGDQNPTSSASSTS